MRPILTTMTALAVVLSGLSNANAAMALNKPVILKKPAPQIIKIRPPRIQMPGNRLKPVRGADHSDRSPETEAGPQPEPPTKPALDFSSATMVVPPLPRPRPNLERDKPDSGEYTHVLKIVASLPSWESVPGDPGTRPYNEFEDQDDAVGGDIDPDGALGPDLPVPPGFNDLFNISTNPNDLEAIAELGKLGAMGEIARLVGGNPFDDPASGLRTGRIGAGMDGPPVGDTSGLGNGGQDQESAGWGTRWKQNPNSNYTQHHTESPTENTFVRQNKFSTDVVRSDTSGSQLYISWNSRDQYGNETGTTTVVADSQTGEWVMVDEDGNVIARGTTQPGTLPPTEHDQDGDGVPDDTQQAGGGDGNGDAGQNVPEDDTAGGGDQGGPESPSEGGSGSGEGGCPGWTPFGGCPKATPKVWETTGQPNPADDGSATVRSAGASIGPEAVTNGGDGSFGAEGNSGRGGGFGIDPCATVAGCGDGAGGPDNPVGAGDGALAAVR